MTKTTKSETRGGGWNRKSLEEHLREGTYRADRHGALRPGRARAKKPPGKVRANAKSQAAGSATPPTSGPSATAAGSTSGWPSTSPGSSPRFSATRKGEWQGEPFTLTAWQRDTIIYPLFGWVRPDGTRRFRRSLHRDPEEKLQEHDGRRHRPLHARRRRGARRRDLERSAATSDQARVVHDEAVDMIEASPKLSAVLKINHSTFNIAYPATKSYYRAVSASAPRQARPSLQCAIADELHEWYGDELWKSIRYAFRAAGSRCCSCITNAGDNLQSALLPPAREGQGRSLSGGDRGRRFFRADPAPSRGKRPRRRSRSVEGRGDRAARRRAAAIRAWAT